MPKKPAPKPKKDEKRLRITVPFEDAIDRVLSGAGKDAPARTVKPRTFTK